MGLFDSKDKTSTSTNQMFPALEAGWNRALGSAGKAFQNSKLPGQAPLNSDITNSFNMTRAQANAGVPNLDQIYGAQSSMLANGGMTPEMQQAYGILGGFTENGGLTDYMRANGAVLQGFQANNGVTSDLAETAGYLKNFANGSYQEDPRLQAQLDTNANRAANAGATRFGGGRYGSAAIGSGIGTAVADANNGIMLQSNENARNRQLQASGQLDSLYQNAANRGVAASNSLDSMYQTAANRATSAAGAMGTLGSQGANNMGTWASMAPALNEMRYDGASRLAGVGDFLQNRTQGRIDQTANFPWQNLQNYTGILGGMGNQGATTVERTPGPSAAQSILGGIGAGAKLGSSIPGLGAGRGGVLGGAFGAFS